GCSALCLLLPICRPPPTPPLIPYTTLFRSHFKFLRQDAPKPHQSGRSCRHWSGNPGLQPGSQARSKHSCDPGPHFGYSRTTRLRSEEHTSELQSRENLVCRLLLEKKKSISN